MSVDQTPAARTTDSASTTPAGVRTPYSTVTLDKNFGRPNAFGQNCVALDTRGSQSSDQSLTVDLSLVGKPEATGQQPTSGSTEQRLEGP